MTTVNYIPQSKLKNGGGDHGSCMGDSDNSSIGGGSELADRDRDLDDAGLDPTLTNLDAADSDRRLKQKKTKGRVKIKMEFIDNKLRRYTTFSKRKTGIMKKAYELSTLTGTQVMLLVASETGHVYTFATRKLQPMITSESGKALIQTCLNSPDIPADSQPQHPDQRMSATGFEETELSYQVSDEEAAKEGKSSLFTVTNVPGAGADANTNSSSSAGLSLTGAGHTFPMTTYLPVSSAAQLVSGGKVNPSISSAGIPMAVPQGASFATLISPTGQTLTPGQAFPAAGILQVQQGQPQVQLQTNTQSQTPAPASTLYRLPQSALAGAASQMVTALVPASTASTTQTTQNSNTVTMLTTPQSSISPAGSANTLAAPLMYHTPQGVVYAASPAGTEGFVFNYQTAATNVSQTCQANVEGSGSTTITGAVPVIPMQLHVTACQQGTITTQANSSLVPAALAGTMPQATTTVVTGGAQVPSASAKNTSLPTDVAKGSS